MILPYVLTKNVASIIEKLDSAGLDSSSIRLQIEPSEKEREVQSCELFDPLGGDNYKITPHLIHQYKNRCLLLTTGRCFGYCRYCFRRNYVGANQAGCDNIDNIGDNIDHIGSDIGNIANMDGIDNIDHISEEELKKICEYLSKHGEIQEILFSGGDPLMLNDERLFPLIDAVRAARPEILVRICTRALFYAPERFTPDLIKKLRSYKPLWIIPHINHFYEISPEFAPQSARAIDAILDAGISMQSQTVLLRGVNDDVSTLATLFEELAKVGIKPGYLFQTDLAQGTSHFRVPIDQAVALYEQLRGELSGLSLPTFAVDLPGGGGKFNLMQLENGSETVRVHKHDDKYEFARNGKLYFYPRA